MPNTSHLRALIDAYDLAPEVYKATSYWQGANRQLLDLIDSIDLDDLRSGRYDILRKFGFGDLKYSRPTPEAPTLRKLRHKLLRTLAPLARRIPNTTPYNLGVREIQNLAIRQATLYGQLAGARPLQDVGVSNYGNPEDIFARRGRRYTMQFLSMYLRYSFAHNHAPFRGDEIIVELGQGNGVQVELLKKLYPGLTILCFDLPIQTYLCEHYLRAALGPKQVISSKKTLDWKTLQQLTPGKVHLFGNWQFDLLSSLERVDWFWNAASFGEMEPDVVRHYLAIAKSCANRIFLLNAEHGKETKSAASSPTPYVQKPTTFIDYDTWLDTHTLAAHSLPWSALTPMTKSGGYFQAVWHGNNQS